MFDKIKMLRDFEERHRSASLNCFFAFAKERRCEAFPLTARGIFGRLSGIQNSKL